MKQIQERIKELLGKLKEFLRKFSKRTKIIFIIATVAVIVGAVIIAAVLNHTEYVVLYSGVTSEESTEILAKLSELQIEYKSSGNGDILVKSDVVDSTRATLAQEGYPKSGFAYDIFKDNVSGMTTDNESQTYKLYDLQDRIGATIRLFEGVKDAKVTIALGNEQKYVLDESATKPSAQVVVITKAGYELSAKQAEGIQRLVAHSVSNMEMSDVVVLDETGVAISISDGASTSGDVGEEIAQIVEGQITRKVWNVLEPFYGSDNIRVSTNCKINMEKVIRESITYSTPEKIDENDKSGIISHEKTDLEASGIGNGAGGVVGTEDNSDISQYVADALANGDNGYLSNIIDRDYLVNQVKEQGELASGAIEDKTVSVAINQGSSTLLDEARIRSLVGTAAGIEAADRNEKISIVVAPFYNSESGDGQGSFFESKYFPYMIAALAALLILTIVIVILMRRRAKKKAEAEMLLEEGIDVIQPEAEDLESEKQQILNMKNDRSKGLREDVRKFADDNPEIAAHMIRDWLHGGDEESGKQ